MKDIKIGDIFYIEKFFNSQRTYIKQVKVCRVGKKYFYLEGYLDPVRKEDLMYVNKNYSQSSFKLYRTIEEIEQKNLRRDLWSSIRQKVGSIYNSEQFTLEEIQQIANILKIAP